MAGSNGVKRMKEEDSKDHSKRKKGAKQSPRVSVLQHELFLTSSTKNSSDDDESETKASCDADLLARVQVGSRLEVLWPDDDEYYEAVVSEMEGGNVYLEYDDGDTEWLDLAGETFRFVNETQNQDKDDVSSNEASKSSDEEYDETSPYEDDYCAEDNEPLFEEVGAFYESLKGNNWQLLNDVMIEDARARFRDMHPLGVNPEKAFLAAAGDAAGHARASDRIWKVEWGHEHFGTRLQGHLSNKCLVPEYVFLMNIRPEIIAMASQREFKDLRSRRFFVPELKKALNVILGTDKKLGQRFQLLKSAPGTSLQRKEHYKMALFLIRVNLALKLCDGSVARSGETLEKKCIECFEKLQKAIAQPSLLDPEKVENGTAGNKKKPKRGRPKKQDEEKGNSAKYSSSNTGNGKRPKRGRPKKQQQKDLGNKKISPNDSNISRAASTAAAAAITSCINYEDDESDTEDEGVVEMDNMIAKCDGMLHHLRKLQTGLRDVKAFMVEHKKREEKKNKDGGDDDGVTISQKEYKMFCRVKKMFKKFDEDNEDDS